MQNDQIPRWMSPSVNSQRDALGLTHAVNESSFEWTLPNRRGPAITQDRAESCAEQWTISLQLQGREETTLHWGGRLTGATVILLLSQDDCYTSKGLVKGSKSKYTHGREMHFLRDGDERLTSRTSVPLPQKTDRGIQASSYQ